MKCVCGYEKDFSEGKWVITSPEIKIPFSSGENKGKICKIIPEKREFIPDTKEDFILVWIDDVYILGKYSNNRIDKNIFACPKCGTLKIEL